MLETTSPLPAVADEAALARTALETLQMAIALVAEDGALSLPNRPCQQILARGDAFALREGRLTCHRENDALLLTRALQNAFAGLRAHTTTAVFAGATGRQYSVSFMRLGGGASTDRCMVLIVDTDAAELANDTWRSLCDLSDGELFLAKQILSSRRH